MEVLQRRTQNSDENIFGDVQGGEGSVASLFQNTQETEEGDRRNNVEKNAGLNVLLGRNCSFTSSRKIVFFFFYCSY